MTSSITLIVAATASNGIGVKGALLWRLPREMAYFAKVTSSAPAGSVNAVIMGRKSWESIPGKFRPLKNRLNIVLSSQRDYDLCTTDDKAVLQPSLQSALDYLNNGLPGHWSLHRTFIIGGAGLYKESLTLPSADRILLTRITSPAFEECDVYLPDFLPNGSPWQQATHQDLEKWTGMEVPAGLQEERGTTYEYQMWIR
ncbi:dihydrofolate reductase [Tulasnella sp. 419]|nr:dihydrofolate reductase [Tulasnella sp. 419]